MSQDVIERTIKEEMTTAYVTYAMSVIVGRALPDIRDGLKPVHRRILYAMHDMGMFHNKSFKKSARIVGEVLGKYHPHGDSAVYDSLVRMAQDFSLRYPLIKGQGNFGSIDGDNAAAMRYTEAKLQKFAEDLLRDIDKDTVDFVENFDASLKEPSVLPTIIPQLLVNGSNGIAVGMATSIPPHNVREVCEATKHVLHNPDVTVRELMEIVPAPDFPTGAECFKGSRLINAYETGHGSVTMQGVASIEDDKIIITEIPYQVNKADLIIQIADLVKDKRVEGIRNINDESDREGIRIVIDLKRDADGSIVLNQLYKYSRLRLNFSMNMLALIDNKPQKVGLKDFLVHHINHRRTVIKRRTAFELAKAEKRLHVLDGLLIALNNIDEIIPLIKNSASAQVAQGMLAEKYGLSEIQSKAILDLKLQKLASLEQEKIRTEHKDLLALCEDLRSILASPHRVDALINDELDTVIAGYGDERRTKVSLGDVNDIDMEDMIENLPQVVTVSKQGYMKRVALDTYQNQGRGGKGIRAAQTKEDDYIAQVYVAHNHDHLLVFTDTGNVHWTKVWKLPESSRTSKGTHVKNLLNVGDAKITNVIPVQNFDEGFLFMATRNGYVKKTPLESFSRPRKGGIRAITLEDDVLIDVRITDGNKQIMLVNKDGMATRFLEAEVRPMGRSARGVTGIKSVSDVVAMIIADDSKHILTITENGYGKRTSVNEYRLCHRATKGVTNFKLSDKTGKVLTSMLVDGTEDLFLVSEQGIGIRVACEGVSVIGRVTQGVRVMRLNDGDKVAAVAKIE